MSRKCANGSKTEEVNGDVCETAKTPKPDLVVLVGIQTPCKSHVNVEEARNLQILYYLYPF